MPADDSLYQRLGGQEAIDVVVDDFYDRVLEDERVDHHFEETDLEELRQHMKRFVGSVTGGPVDYDGRGLAAAHQHLGITESEFDVVAEHLAETLVDHDVPEPEREALLSTVADTKPAVVSD